MFSLNFERFPIISITIIEDLFRIKELLYNTRTLIDEHIDYLYNVLRKCRRASSNMR